MQTRAKTEQHAGDYERIGAALRYLQRNRRRNVPLREIADSVGLSEYHFQRLFTRWTGVSPKRFAGYLTLDYARSLLRDATSVLDTTYAAGLSSPSRLHDLFVTIDAVTPGEFKSGGRDLTIEYGDHPCPFGRCLLGVTERGVCWLSFADSADHADGLDQLRATWPAANLRENTRRTTRVAQRIFAPSGRRTGTPLSVLVGGTNFQLKVWEALLRIPPGRLVTYGDVATAIGRATSARAVGNAVGANRVSFLIPCHRVIRSMGVISSYRWGPERKRAILAWEAARHAEPPVEQPV